MMDLNELSALPPEIRAESEQPFSAIGSIDLLWETSIRPDGSLKCTHYNQAIVGDKTWRVAGQAYKDAHRPMVDVPLNGYIVGDLLVLESSSIKTLSASELAVSDEFFENAPNLQTDPVTGGQADPSVTALIGGKVYSFESESIIEHVEDVLAKATTKAASGEEDRTVNHGLQWLPTQASGGSNGSIVQASPFQADNIRVLFIRAEFSDVTANTVGFNELTTSLEEANARIQQFSYGKASLSKITVTPNIYTLPTPGQTVAESGDSDKIIAEARAAVEADFNISDFDVIGVFFPNIGKNVFPASQIDYGGLATVGGENHWINGVSQAVLTEILLHEFGHNYGLFHANYFNPERDFTAADSGANAVEYLDPGQVSLEYGDIYDRMGEGNKDDGYFSPYATFRLEWMPPSKVIEPTTSGLFRVSRFDHPDAKNNTTLALRLPMGGDRYNWVALRQRYDDTAGKAYVVGEGIYTDRPNLIDATPGSNPNKFLDRADSTLSVADGPYDDVAAGVTIRNIGTGGSEDNEYIDVQVDFDPRISIENSNILVDESAGHAAVSINRTFNSNGVASVGYSTSAGSADSADFHPTSGTVSWDAGDMSPKKILIPIRPDTLSEGAETFTLTLSNPTNAVIERTRDTTTITIGDAGSRITSFDPPFFNLTINAIVPLPDGKVIAAGTINDNVTGNIARFNADGSEDSGFLKGSGFKKNPIPPETEDTDGTVEAMILQADGKIVVGGRFDKYNNVACRNLVRLNSDGTVDVDFCNSLGAGPDGTVRAIAQQADGSILVGGSFLQVGSVTSAGIVKISQSGLASQYVSPGLFTAGLTPQIYDIDVASDGKIMLCGAFATGSGIGSVFKFSIARLEADGTLDTSFDPGFGAHGADIVNGEPVQVHNRPTFVTSISSLMDNGNLKYLICGNFPSYNDVTRGSLALVNADGSLDTGFEPGVINGQVLEVFVDSAGRLLAGGTFLSIGSRIAALKPDGSIDTSLNLGSGITRSFVSAFASDAEGNSYIGGNFYDFGGQPSRPIVKIAGGLDPFTLWKTASFSPAQLAAGNTGAEEDFDNDGILNITEMALGLSPTVANSPESFAIAAEDLSVQTTGESQFLQATMIRSAENLGVWLVAQFSSDLVTWLPANPIPGSNATYEVVESTSNRFTVKDKTPSGLGVKRFVRFRAVVPN